MPSSSRSSRSSSSSSIDSSSSSPIPLSRSFLASASFKIAILPLAILAAAFFLSTPLRPNKASLPTGPSCSKPISIGAIMFICMRTISFCFFSFSLRFSRLFLVSSRSLRSCSSSCIFNSSSMDSTAATSLGSSAVFACAAAASAAVFLVGNPKISRTFRRHRSKSLNSFLPRTLRSPQQIRISSVVSGILSKAASATSPLAGWSKESLLYPPKTAIGSRV